MILGLGCSRRQKTGRKNRLRQSVSSEESFYRCLYNGQGEIRDLGPKVYEIRKCATELTHIQGTRKGRHRNSETSGCTNVMVLD